MGRLRSVDCRQRLDWRGRIWRLGRARFTALIRGRAWRGRSWRRLGRDITAAGGMGLRGAVARLRLARRRVGRRACLGWGGRIRRTGVGGGGGAFPWGGGGGGRGGVLGVGGADGGEGVVAGQPVNTVEVRYT